MQAKQRLEFESSECEKLYGFIERNGVVYRGELESEFSMDPQEVDEALESLVDAGHIEKRGETFRIKIDYDASMTFETDGIEVTIRTPEQSDLGELVGVMRTVAEEDAYLTAETVVDLLDHEEVIFRHNDIESRMFLVATVDDDLVGWVHLHSPNVAKLSHTAELTMGILKEYRGHGIGSRLMEHGLDWAESNGYEKVYQSLPAVNQDAVQFLERHNWETEAIRQAHFKIDDEYVAEQQMAVMLEAPVTG